MNHKAIMERIKNREAKEQKQMEIEQGVDNAINYIKSGWDLSLAVRVAHDAVYDLIDIDGFISLVQQKVKETKNEQQSKSKN